MKTKALLIAAVMAAGIATPLAAQTSNWQTRSTYQGNNTYWRGAPDGLQQRIDWLQDRISRGTADGSLSQGEARRAQYQLQMLRRDATLLQQRLDNLSQSIRWARRDGNGSYGSGYGSGYNNGYGNNGYNNGYNNGSGRDPYATDYDASRYYRDNPNYPERRLGTNDEVYRGSDGRYYCKRNDGTTGLIIGGIGGAAAGNVIDGGHERLAGTLIGGALGALLGKTIDQSNSDVRCR